MPIVFSVSIKQNDEISMVNADSRSIRIWELMHWI